MTWWKSGRRGDGDGSKHSRASGESKFEKEWRWERRCRMRKWAWERWWHQREKWGRGRVHFGGAEEEYEHYLPRTEQNWTKLVWDHMVLHTKKKLLKAVSVMPKLSLMIYDATLGAVKVSSEFPQYSWVLFPKNWSETRQLLPLHSLTYTRSSGEPFAFLFKRTVHQSSVLAMCSIFCVLILWHLGPPDQDQVSVFFKCKPTSPESTPQPQPLWGFHTPGHKAPTLITPQPSTR